MVTGDTGRRILILDSDKSAGADLRNILAAQSAALQLTSGGSTPACDQKNQERAHDLQIDSAADIAIGIDKVRHGRLLNNPIALAFVVSEVKHAERDLDPVARLLAADEALQIVFCAVSGSDTSWSAWQSWAASGRVLLLKRPFEAAEAWLLTTSLLEKWRITRANQQQSRRSTPRGDEAQDVISIIGGCFEELEQANDELRRHALELTERLAQREVEVIGTRDLAMFALAQLADSRDPETGEHLLRMRAYAQSLAEWLAQHGPYRSQIDRAFLEDFYRSTPLHDIGKVGIPDQILLKPGTLTAEEYAIMKRHTVIGAEALEKAVNQSCFGGFLTMAGQIARWHHEKFDGSGYPDGLSGEEIPLCARVTAVADVFDALTSARVYKNAMPADEARIWMLNQAGRHFDPAVIKAFVACFDKLWDAKVAIDGGHLAPGTSMISFDQPLPLFESAESYSPA